MLGSKLFGHFTMMYQLVTMFEGLKYVKHDPTLSRLRVRTSGRLLSTW